MFFLQNLPPPRVGKDHRPICLKVVLIFKTLPNLRVVPSYRKDIAHPILIAMMITQFIQKKICAILSSEEEDEGSQANKENNIPNQTSRSQDYSWTVQYKTKEKNVSVHGK